MPRILVIDNDPSILSVLSAILGAEGYEPVSVRDGEAALEHIKSEEFDLIISDVRMTPVDGMAILKSAHAEQPRTSVIMLTAFGTVEAAIGAMKLGAFDYVTKPFKVDELLITVERGLEYKRALNENLDLRAQLKTQYRFENMVAESPSMKRVCAVIEKVAPSDTTILIYGESGTGKELVAKAIHTYSHRKDKRFLAVNCAALPEALLESEMFGHVKGAFTGASSNKKGLIEEAGDGTIFLDEIGGMPISVQAKFLRVLQEKELRRVGGNDVVSVNARVLAATNVPLEELIKKGLFREDLYYRLNIIPITIEPLRRRKEDIMPLVRHVIRKEVGDDMEIHEVGAGVCDVLEKYSWPGNVRELENAVKHALAFSGGGTITKSVLPSKILGAVARMELDDGTGYSFISLKDFVQSKEQEYIEQVLEAVGGDKEKAAKALNVSLATFYRKLPHLKEEA
ncbi:MAG: sigma-54-dependent Fis family transcriptional regulator [Kiritimatiellae bacterium]|nr:sigma-54-dependent Fis family transcriptional regulator [Kiritimatiellia bacterium]